MSKPLTVRSVRDEETDDVLAFVRSRGVAPLARTTWDGLGMAGYVGVLGSGDDEEIVAVLPIEPREVFLADGRVARVLHQVGVYVDEGQRRQGLATLLQGQVLNIARQLGAAAVTAYAAHERAYQWYGHSEMFPELAIDRFELDGADAGVGGEPAAVVEAVEDVPAAAGQVRRPLGAWAEVHPRALVGSIVTAYADAGKAVLGIDGGAAEVLAWEADDGASLIDAVRALAGRRGWRLGWSASDNDPLHDALAAAGTTGGVAARRHLMVRPVADSVDTSGWRFRAFDEL